MFFFSLRHPTAYLSLFDGYFDFLLFCLLRRKHRDRVGEIRRNHRDCVGELGPTVSANMHTENVCLPVMPVELGATAAPPLPSKEELDVPFPSDLDPSFSFTNVFYHDGRACVLPAPPPYSQ